LLVFRELKENLINASSLALGVFDGVHLGHQKVISNAIKKAEENGLVNAVVTFSKHPRDVVMKHTTQTISPLEERLQIFEKLGVENTIILDFDEKFAKMPAEKYLKDILLKCLNAKNITIGYNHKFGGDKLGNSKFLEENSEKYGYKVNSVSPVKIDGHVVSSSAVRKLILKGEMEAVSRFLGRDFCISGIVVHGQHLGRTIGFPTANLDFDGKQIFPLNGVYAGVVKISSKMYHTVINIGKRPTIGDLEKPIIEAHILDFDKDIYGEKIEISFLSRIRDEKKFNSLDELKTQIQKDCDLVLKNSLQYGGKIK